LLAERALGTTERFDSLCKRWTRPSGRLDFRRWTREGTATEASLLPSRIPTTPTYAQQVLLMPMRPLTPLTGIDRRPQLTATVGAPTRDHDPARRRTWALAVRLALVAMLAVVLVPLEQPESWSTPVTLSETLEGLPAAADGGADTAQASTAGQRSDPVASPIAFSAVGFTAPPSTTSLRVRTAVAGEWSPWDEVGFMDVEDGPDPDSAEAAVEAPGLHAELLWVGEADELQLEVEGASPEDIDVTVIDSMHLNDGPVERHVAPIGGAAADANGLNIVSRAQWGSNESWTGSTRSVKDVHMGVVHHTAHASGWAANNYSRADAPGLVRSFQRYHTQSLGWSDIGYNALVDRFGTIYEGRKGGFTNGVVGAHAAGWNTGSFGVAVIGNFVDTQASPEAIKALTDVISTKAAIHGIDTTGWTNKVGNNSWKPTIIGHRDVGQTSCPGRIMSLLPKIREDARANSVRFPDVPSNSPHRTSILTLADAGVTNGCEANLYCPGATLTRAQAASFMVRAFDLQPVSGSARFRDVPSSSVHFAAVNTMHELGWMQGYTDGTFGPWDELSRGQLASLLARGLPDHAAAGGLWSPPYPDVPTNSVHYDGIMALAEQGIRGNCGGGNFCLYDDVKRDSTATFVLKVRELHGLESQGEIVEELTLDEDGLAADDSSTDDTVG
jgi:hypothetical protein